MNKKNQQKIYQHNNIKHRCSRCSIVSKDVHKSLRFKEYLCTDCLKDVILNSN